MRLACVVLDVDRAARYDHHETMLVHVGPCWSTYCDETAFQCSVTVLWCSWSATQRDATARAACCCYCRPLLLLKLLLVVLLLVTAASSATRRHCLRHALLLLLLLLAVCRPVRMRWSEIHVMHGLDTADASPWHRPGVSLSHMTSLTRRFAAD